MKWIEDRREHFIATTQERDEIWEMEIAVDAEARILGVRGRLIHDNGAYMVRGVNVPYGAASTLTLAYVVPALDLEVLAVATNKVPVTPIRGAGKPQGVFVMERLLDLVAREMRLDRAEVRRRNLVPRAQIPYATPMKTRGGMQVVLDAGDYPACLAAALDRARLGRLSRAPECGARQGPLHRASASPTTSRARGAAPTSRSASGSRENGRIHVASGAAAIGQGTKTMLAQIVAEQLGADLGNITRRDRRHGGDRARPRHLQQPPGGDRGAVGACRRACKVRDKALHVGEPHAGCRRAGARDRGPARAAARRRRARSWRWARSRARWRACPAITFPAASSPGCRRPRPSSSTT